MTIGLPRAGGLSQHWGQSHCQRFGENKTDIPTFYGEWFENRLDAGYCKMVNPYNRKAYRVSLVPDDVDGFVFWTKNAGPFLGKLAVVSERGYPFIVQYTINGYPRTLSCIVTCRL